MEALYSMLDRPLGAPSFSAEAAVLAFLLAFVLGQAIAWTYTRTHTGLSYSRSFTQSLVLITVVVAMVMFVIGDSIVTAFGLLGALVAIPVTASILLIIKQVFIPRQDMKLKT